MSARRAPVLIALLLCVAGGWAFLQVQPAGVNMTKAAAQFLGSLDADQRETVALAYDADSRTDWHFIPKDYRKGLQIRDMSKPQREHAHRLLRSCLSQVGYGKATQIMALEQILHELEKGREGGNIRDTERYYFTLFGTPSEKGKWGLSIEGHHLSLNFVVDGGQVISSTPSFFAANPATVKSDVDGGLPVGTRVLAKEEQLAFDLLAALDDDQRKQAVIADQAPREIRAAGEPQPPQEDPVGITYGDMNESQQAIFKQLVKAYIDNMPSDVQERQIEGIMDGGPDNVHFAWAGASQPGIGHYYRIQGPSFLIEFVNTQPDPAGNPANHIHCVYRDMNGDFAMKVEKS